MVVRASLAGAKDALEDLKQMQALSRKIMDGLAAYAAQLEDAQKQSDDVCRRMAESMDQIDTVSRQQVGYLKTVSTMQADVGRLADAMQKAAADLRDSAASVERSHLQANKALQEEFTSTMDAYRDYVNQFTQRVDYLSDNISGALQAMPAAVSEANNRFLDQVDRMTDAMVQAQRALEVTADRLYRG